MMFYTIYSCAVSAQLSHPISSLDSFERLLRAHQIETLVDIRRSQVISSEPQFDDKHIRRIAESLQINYHWAGRQFANNFLPTQEGPDVALNSQLRGFANYMRGDQFAQAYRHLLNLANKSRTLIFSNTPNLQLCTRRLIADYLSIQGHQVIQLLDSQRQIEHQLSVELRRESAVLIYDRQI